MALDIIQLNIERFRRLLAEATDVGRRRLIEQLLAEEEAKRAEQRPDRPPEDPPPENSGPTCPISGCTVLQRDSGPPLTQINATRTLLTNRERAIIKMWRRLWRRSRT